MEIWGDPPEILVASDHVILRTSSLYWRVELSPFRMIVQNESESGRLITEIGGKEKNNFGQWDTLNTGMVHNGEQRIATENFSLAPGEGIYGFGEKFLRLEKTGQTVDLDMDDALGVLTPRSYKNVPFYVSTAGYGIYFNHSSRMTFWVGSRSAADIQVAVDDPFLDYFFIAGSIKDVLAGYTRLTGRPQVPPAWTFGYWQSKISYKSAEEVLEIARQMRAHQIPCDVIHLDTFWFKEDWYCDLEFDPVRFPDPEGFFKQLKDLGIRVSLWQLPYIPEGSAYFEELKAVDGFVKTKDGAIYDSKTCFTPGFKGVVGIIDFTNPKAVAVFQARVRRLLELGASVIKTDFGEFAPVDGVYHNGTLGRRMHNLYPLLYNKAAFEVTQAVTGEGVVWARSAWAGSQRYPLHWGGDSSPNFHNIIPQLCGGLSLGLSGFAFWSQDIGGFCGTTDDLLLICWMQFGMFLSHSRIHGYGDRELHKFSAKVLEHCRDVIQLRYSLIPYILGSAVQSASQSLPMARALVIEFQEDPTTWGIGDEYLFGDSFLVAPIFTADGFRRIYLPEGEWTSWWTGTRERGLRWIDAQWPLDQFPLYLRDGALVPTCAVSNYVGEVPLKKLKVKVTPHLSPGASRTLPVVINGDQAKLTWTFDGRSHTLTYEGPALEIIPEWVGPDAGIIQVVVS
jgi:alpha-D-xyloside xylohydrolase